MVFNPLLGLYCLGLLTLLSMISTHELSLTISEIMMTELTLELIFFLLFIYFTWGSRTGDGWCIARDEHNEQPTGSAWPWRWICRGSLTRQTRLQASAPAVVNEVSGDVVFLLAARAGFYPSHRRRDGFDWILFWAETRKNAKGSTGNARREKVKCGFSPQCALCTVAVNICGLCEHHGL